jgi:hypothetical protein
LRRGACAASESRDGRALIEIYRSDVKKSIEMRFHCDIPHAQTTPAPSRNSPMNVSSPVPRSMSKTLVAFLALLLSSLLFPPSARAELTVDNNFLPPTFTRSILPQKAVLLPDGKYFLLFNPDTLTDQPTGPLTRYLPDGTLDTSFAFSRDYKDVQAITPTSSGKY